MSTPTTATPLVCGVCGYLKSAGDGSWLVTDSRGRPLYYHPCPACTTDPERLAWLARIAPVTPAGTAKSDEGDDEPEHDCSDDPCDRHNPYLGDRGGNDEALNQSLRDAGRGHLVRE